MLKLKIARNFWNSILRSITGNRATMTCINTFVASTSFESLEESLASRSVLRPLEESVFIREGDYWSIRYQGQTAILKATRGLDCLGYLLRRPGREVHVSELPATAIDSQGCRCSAAGERLAVMR